MMSKRQDDFDAIRQYYGKVLGSSDDLQTTACCSMEFVPLWLRKIFAELDDEILERFYGCGSPIPPCLEGRTVLDLGCGTGRDVYVCSRLAGEQGRVIGLDMTEEQLEVARKYADAQARRFGYQKSNVEFHQGYMEDLAGAGIADNSVDVVISNCVINLSPHKERVFSEIFRVLKDGGELYFSDVFADRRLPGELRDDPVLLGECLAGAMYLEDFRRLLGELGVSDYRVVLAHPISIENPQIEARVGMARFHSLTIRIFKLPSLEDRCEDYGQVATYQGTIPHAPHSFVLDDHHEFFTNKPMLVCGNTAAMVGETRLAPHFNVQGDHNLHHGLFPCGPQDGAAPAPKGEDTPGGCC